MKKYSKKGWQKKSEEIKAMRELWEDSKDEQGLNYCAETGQTLPLEYSPGCVMHVWSKRANPKYRSDKRNMMLVTYFVHQQYDFGDKTKLKIYPECQRIIEMLKLEDSQGKNINNENNI